MDIIRIDGSHADSASLKAYEAVLGALHGPDFETAVVESFRGALAWERLYIYQGRWDGDANLRVACYEPGLDLMLPLYRREYMRGDPMGRAVMALGKDMPALALRLGPADIPDEGYRRLFFEARGIVERISVLQRSEQGWRGVNIARHARIGRCGQADFSALAGMAQLILPMVDKHFAAQAGQDNLSAIEGRFRRRCPALTKREGEVCARAALGMSVEATALDLGIGTASVLTYRRRAYGRLGVTSPYELAALVLQ